MKMPSTTCPMVVKYPGIGESASSRVSICRPQLGRRKSPSRRTASSNAQCDVTRSHGLRALQPGNGVRHKHAREHDDGEIRRARPSRRRMRRGRSGCARNHPTRTPRRRRGP